MKKRIVVLGGGFAGIECIKKLEKYFKNQTDVELILISEDNFWLFTPMLPQVASGMIETRSVVIPIRTIIKNTLFYEGRVKNIDPYKKIVNLWGSGDRPSILINYDHLVVALGGETNFFGMDDLKKNAYQMKTLNDAMLVRNQIIDMLEQAENETDSILKKSLLRIVIVGGGFAGIETAGEIMDLLSDAVKHYTNITMHDIEVVVLEALPTILPGFAKSLTRFAHKHLEKRGIQIMLRTTVTGFDGKNLMLKNLDNTAVPISSIQTRTVIWTAGITPVNTIKRSLFKTQKGKIIVNKNLEVVDFPGVFAVGDCALFLDSQKKHLPPTAQVAEAQAGVAAYNIYAMTNNINKKEFVYKSRGQMAIIGKKTGIALLFGMNIHGLLAWVIWRNIYLSKIPTWHKRFQVLLDWTADAVFNRDISRLKFVKYEPEKEYKLLDEVDDVW